MHPTPGDEAPHDPPDSADASWKEWKEWWSFDFADPAGASGALRLAFAPAGGAASWWTRLEVPDEGLVVVRDDELSLPRRAGALVVRGDSLWVDLLCETAFEHWTIGMEAFGLRVDHLEDEVGERLPVGLDLEWEVLDGEAPEGVDVPRDAGRGYAQDGTMRGEVLVGDRRLELDATSHRDHHWGC